VLCVMLKIPQLTKRFSIRLMLLLRLIHESSMFQAAREAMKGNKKDVPLHISPCFDGSWQRHGDISNSMSVTFFNTEKVLDVRIMRKF